MPTFEGIELSVVHLKYLFLQTLCTCDQAASFLIPTDFL